MSVTWFLELHVKGLPEGRDSCVIRRSVSSKAEAQNFIAKIKAHPYFQYVLSMGYTISAHRCTHLYPGGGEIGPCEVTVLEDV